MRFKNVALAGCACLLLASCGRDTDATPTLAAQPPAAAPAAESGALVPHGDHNPHHGGLVLMNGDLHFEIVADRNGLYRLYFSDATRNELPAATASGVTLTISKKGQQPSSDTVTMHIDDTGEFWGGRGGPVHDPAATLHIAYTANGKPYFIDVPFPR